MKKTFTIADARRAFLLCAVAAFCAGCAFTDSGNRLNEDRKSLESLERQREDYESRYVIVLNSLEKNIGDAQLERERDKLRKKIQELSARIREQRQEFDRTVREWEDKIAQDELQREMIEKEERKNAYKVEGD